MKPAAIHAHCRFAVKVYHDKLARYNLTHAFFTDAAGDAAQAEEQARPCTVDNWSNLQAQCTCTTAWTSLRSQCMLLACS